MLDARYFLTTDNLDGFIDDVRKLLCTGTVTILAPGGFLKVLCTIRGLAKYCGGVYFEEVSHDGEVTPRQIQAYQLSPHENRVIAGRPRVQVEFRANTLQVLVYDGTSNLPRSYLYVANREPEEEGQTW